MGWWDPIVFPIRRVWIGVATRLGIRKTGMRRLMHEVSTCEYEDVRVMWEMLSRTTATAAAEGEVGRHRSSGRKRQAWEALRWAPRGASFSFCRSF